MPRHDGTGPSGNGRPGRGLGPCGRFGSGKSRIQSAGSTTVNIILDIVRSILEKKQNKKGG